MQWRIIEGSPREEAMHHALDKTLIDRLNDGEMRPTLRFWYRKHPAIPMGRFQSFQDEIQEEYVEKEGIEVVRRITGGGAMYVEPEDVITYSMYVPREKTPADIEESYRELDGWTRKALAKCGLDVHWAPLNDIEHPDGKVGGAAQLRKGDSVLHHTTLSYDLDTEKMLKALRIGEEKVSDKAIKSAEKRVVKISDYIDQTREEVITEMKKEFKKTYGGEEDSLAERELDRARELAGEKFSKDEWNRKM